MKRNKILIVLLFAFLGCLGQDYQDDAALWFHVQLEKKINDKFRINLRQKNRINDNFSTYHLGYLDAGLIYTLSKNFKMSVNYVFGYRLANDYTFEDRQRAYVALYAKKKIGKWSFTYRNRFQVQWRNPYSDEDGTVIRFYDRNKLTVKYELTKRINLYASEELYLPLYQANGKGLDRSRSFLGMTYSLDKRSDFDLAFGYQHQLNAFNVTHRLFIYSVGYVYSF